MARKLSKQSREQISAIIRSARRLANTGPLPDKRAAILRAYCENVAEDDLLATEPAYLAQAILSHLSWGRDRRAGSAKVRVFNPDPKHDGWHSENTIVQVVNDDMPFLVDSLTMCLNELGRGIQVTMHPILRSARTRAGRLKDLKRSNNETDGRAESFIYMEIGKELDAADLAGIKAALEAALSDVRAAVDDWQPMVAELKRSVEHIRGHAPSQPGVLEESCALIDWLADDHFTLLGYCEYRLHKSKRKDRLVPLAQTGLGLLREDRDEPVGSIDLIGLDQREARSKNPLVITKAQRRSRVHRRGHLDQISIKTFDKDGAATGVRRFLGLFTSTAYNENPLDIPLVRLKVQEVMRESGLDSKSHRGKALQHILNNFPRDDLYQISIADLARISAGILDLQERRQVRLFCRRDALSRYYSCFVYLPRDHYTAPTRQRIEKILLESFSGTHIETKLTISESVLARLEATIRTPTARTGAPKLRDIEKKLRAAVASWSDKLRAVLLERLDEQPALELYHRFATVFPVSYQDEVSPRSAAEDIEDLAGLIDGASRIRMSLAPAPNSGPTHLRLRTCRLGEAIPLYTIVPILERMSMKVLSERVYRIDTAPAAAWLQEVDLEPADARTHDAAELEPHFLGCILAALDGDCENDEFNSFVVLAGLHWREAALLRAYCKHLLQTGLPFSQAYMHQVLARHPNFARALVERFLAQFDPDMPGKTRAALEEAARAEIAATLEGVSNLDEDRILRAFLGELDATLRTNFFRLENDKPRDYVALKLDPKKLVELPRPRPMFEIFVYSPRVEGVHLRGGRVARGGLRWSDRREDFRTEVLGLMKAQQVKNTIIVPTGAKGGFVCKTLPEGDRETVQAEVVACYKTFVSGLLDVTDNIVGERIVTPERVRRRDKDDPYLVVAADKGTATFSDIANEISAAYGFWLGDAFASGGSAGYDHKKMGITARGAWESVKRHFRELGTDIQTEPVTVIGIGDMSGDVFGNGMLLSEQLKVVAAFNHRHIFLDPEPDPAVSFAERKRLFDLPRSGWDDYDPAKLSPGGGIYSRHVKSIELHSAAQKALGLDKSSYTPLELIRAILTMDADLFWNGGIGTYVKAQSESHTDAGDPANDNVRVNANELRCKVVGEGGNLGLTQLARIEFALRGGLLYTDFIDNAGGVNSSDREVNIKILLNQAIRDDELQRSRRNALLARMTDDIAGLVLEDNYAQTQALSMLNAHSFERLGENARLIRTLESQGLLDRALEFLPTEEGIVERRSLGKGLTQPELAVLLSYAKIGLTSQLLRTDIPEDTYLDDELEIYFPPRLSTRFAASMRSHRLRREIVAMRIANHVVNRMGPAFTYRTAEDTGAPIGQVVRAYAIARDVFSVRPIWKAIQAADGSVPTALQYNLMFQLSRRLRRAVYWLLERHSRKLDIGELVAKMQPMADAVTGQVLELEAPASQKRLRNDTQQLVAMGVSPELARKLAALSVLPQTLDIIEIAERQKLDVDTIARLYFGLGQGLEIKWIRQEIEDLNVEGRWQAVARDTLRQNLARRHCAVLGKILSSRGSQQPRDALVGWLEAHSADVARVRQIVNDMRTSEGADFATLSVAIREIERLT